MGALHDGHGALIAAGAQLGRVTVSVFVNPTQFGPGEDYGRYPRQTEQDEAYARARGADEVWFPEVEDVYPRGPEATEEPGPLGEVLEGAARADHFAGVLTVVRRLFELSAPDVAVFGEKDWQQLVLVERLARRLGGPSIHPVPTVRDDDGLALSSRNAYLSDEERERALALPRSLAAVEKAWRRGERGAAALERVGMEAAGVEASSFEYLAARPRSVLPETETLGSEAVALAAARFGSTRLIDNRPL